MNVSRALPTRLPHPTNAPIGAISPCHCLRPTHRRDHRISAIILGFRRIHVEFYPHHYFRMVVNGLLKLQFPTVTIEVDPLRPPVH